MKLANQIHNFWLTDLLFSSVTWVVTINFISSQGFPLQFDNATVNVIAVTKINKLPSNKGHKLNANVTRSYFVKEDSTIGVLWLLEFN